MMEKTNNVLNFDDGMEELKINGDDNRVLRFNPLDQSILDKIMKANNEISAKLKDLEKETMADKDKFDNMDKFVKEKIDGIFGIGTSQIVFGNASAVLTSKGSYIYENFLIAVMEYMTKKANDEIALSKKRIEEYTKKAEELKK